MGEFAEPGGLPQPETTDSAVNLAGVPERHTDVSASAAAMPAAEVPESGGFAVGERPVGEQTEPRHTALPTDTTVSPDWMTDNVVESSPPSLVGRYPILRLIGEGGFGKVYLAKDELLGREVAVKIPRADRLTTTRQVEEFLREAQTVARLRHSAIVSVFDIGQLESGVPFVVQEYIKGETLEVRLRAERSNLESLVRVLLRVAEGVHYAHKQGVVHRDLKPSNILLDLDSEPRVADFGLALNEDRLESSCGEIAGTPAYMSPEQVRGEAHRLDGRNDVWSLGVILYQILTGRTPFSGTRDQIFAQILNMEPRPPRQMNDRVPKELERICLKALAKRVNERYTTARDLADDLECFLKSPVAVINTPASPSAPRGAVPREPGGVEIVPKGLRSFDGNDADFFLELLPGPRDRDGLPEILRFWKSRIEARDHDPTFSVGLIYGPSGCGKSSLIKAGLLPRLVRQVIAVYLEASPLETETRLVAALRRHCPEVPDSLGLVDAILGLRRGWYRAPDQKVVIVLDQFEQWLHAGRNQQGTEFVRALRQCDGDHVQALVLVRDDFWLAASRFMKDLDIPLLEGENCGMVELFDLHHARHVLTLLGQAYGILPDTSRGGNRDREMFFDQALLGLAQDGQIMPVRLTLFAQMMKDKPWIPATLRAVGGAEGVGVTFLEETFSAPTASRVHRYHQRAAQAILRVLLPENQVIIKGRIRSLHELEASGYEHRPEDFRDLMRILDTELRLITPTDPEGAAGSDPVAMPGGQLYFQLTHDYVVQSVQKWLSRKQRETRRGRTELRLAERAGLWNVRPENRYLPSLGDWLVMRATIRPRDWTNLSGE